MKKRLLNFGMKHLKLKIMDFYYMHVLEQTDEEKRLMYMKCKKAELVAMLMECHRIINRLTLPLKITTVGEMDKFAKRCGFKKHVNDELKTD